MAKRFQPVFHRFHRGGLAVFHRFHRGGLVVAAGLLMLAAASNGLSASPVDPLAALQEGNRLFRGGQIEAAVEAYTSGYSPSSPHPTLLYNLGTALHRLDRLPEAILWYRRGADSEDPWLQENLWLARRGLGSQALPAGGSLGWLTRHAEPMRLAAVAIAWIVLLAVIAWPRFPVWGLLASGLIAASLYGGAFAVDRWGPRPAVVLEDCFTAAGELPAGTEAWVRPTADGGWRVSGSDNAVCDREAVRLIFPDA